MKLATVIPYLNIIQKIYKSRDVDISFFYQQSVTFVTSRNTDIDCILIHNSNFLNFLGGFKFGFIKRCCNFDDVRKVGYSRLKKEVK